MGQLFKEYLTGDRIYCCRNCKAHAATHDQIYAKTFQGRFGKAYLFNNVVNVCLGPTEDRQLITGLHTVNDIHCSSCYQILGWRYEKAYEDKEKYKEGKYIIEKTRMQSRVYQEGKLTFISSELGRWLQSSSNTFPENCMTGPTIRVPVLPEVLGKGVAEILPRGHFQVTVEIPPVYDEKLKGRFELS